MIRTEITNEIIKKLRECEKRAFGSYHKVVFHLHTPESHDYKVDLDNEKIDFYSATFEQILESGMRYGLISPEKVSLLGDKYEGFNSVKEYLAYYLLAMKLSKENIEIVVVSDHHTILGIDKLKKACSDLKRSGNQHVPNIIPGIEISCADSHHVVGIFPNTSSITQWIGRWIDEVSVSKKYGTYLTSIQVLSKINENGGVGYIAHINTSNAFKSDFSIQFRNCLFSLEYLNIIGVRSVEQKEEWTNRLHHYINKDFCFVLDEDSHSISEAGQNAMWLKGNRCNYETVITALRDHAVSIELSNPRITLSYVKGLYVLPGVDGFLTDKKHDSSPEKSPFCAVFSPSLNCCIGGRGSGKSTMLNILEIMLKHSCSDIKSLKLISSYEQVDVLYSHNNNDYLIEFFSPVKEYQSDNIYKMYLRGTIFSRQENCERDQYVLSRFSEYVNLYELNADSLERREIKGKEKYDMFTQFLTSKYSINQLVQEVNTDRINNIIMNTLLSNETLSFEGCKIVPKGVMSFIAFLNQIDEFMKTRKAKVESLINSYNKENEGSLKIVYNQDLNRFFLSTINSLIKCYGDPSEKYFHKYNINFERLREYLCDLAEKMGSIDFLRVLATKKYLEITSIESVYDYCTDLTIELINEDIVELDNHNLLAFWNEIHKTVFTKTNLTTMTGYFNDAILQAENFDIEFNINNKETQTDNQPYYKSITELSLGQTVVTLLTFILSYSDYSGDYTPLIIDQPEDNLDNQYIYKNLVQKLREAKSKRQVIIATHNATLVTNTMAEQVIVLDSNERSGWIKATGYPADRDIVNHILNYLEGGKASFQHKTFIYRDIVKNRKSKAAENDDEAVIF